MHFKDLGRMVLEACITGSLGDDASRYDIPALVNAYVDRFGYCDIDGVDPAQYRELVQTYQKPEGEGAPPFG